MMLTALGAAGFWDLLVEPWQYQFMQRALLVTLVASVVCVSRVRLSGRARCLRA